MTVVDNLSIFASESAFEQAFANGLQDMLESAELGAFILVLANASYAKNIFEQLRQPLRQGFRQWQELLQDQSFVETLAADDVAVFNKLQQTSFDNLQLSRFRNAEIWQLQFNQLRSFRPARNANQRFDSMQQDFNVNGFHFNKPFLRKEILFEGVLQERPVRLMYNKFPFVPMHGLLLIEPEKQKPQLLQQQDHEFIWRWLHEASDDLPVGVGFNALGAYASVNHQHFQTFVSRKKMPVELGLWQHNGGSLAYPLPCRRFINAHESWQYLNSLHQANQPYNLLYRQGEMFCISRRFQGHYQQADWTGGFAWAETMGSIITTTEEDFNALDDQHIRSEMQKLYAVG